MTNKEKYTIEFIKENNLIILNTISGSRAYGTAIKGVSDTDYRGVFIMKKEDFYSLDYVEQISDKENDITYYELKRFLQLCLQNNPNIIELLAVPKDCIIYKHSSFAEITPKLILSKLCKNTFGGYAIHQISKSRGLKKKIVNPIAKEKKTPIDFCYIINNNKSFNLRKILEQDNMNQLFCGLVNVPNARDIYSLYYDLKADMCFNENRFSKEEREDKKKKFKLKGEKVGLGYKGIEKENSNEIRLSSIPKDEKPMATVSYNKDGYTKYCKDYREYWEWTEKRNPHRYNIAVKKQYDTKNMLHCHRLLEMSGEIAKDEKIIVRRPNRDFLLKIRNGEMEYDKLLNSAEELNKKVDKLYKTSSLPEKPNYDEINKLLIKIRTDFYEKNK